MSFEVGVHVVDAEIDADVELQPPGVLIDAPILIGDSEEFIPTASIKNTQDGIPIRFVPGTSIDLCLGFEVGSLIFEGVVSPVVAIEDEMLLDQLQELLIFSFEVRSRLILFVSDWERLAVAIWFFCILGGGCLRFTIHFNLAWLSFRIFI